MDDWFRPSDQEWKDRLLSPELVPRCKRGGVSRIVTHWTAGTYEPSHLDLQHYHILIDGQGNVIKGNHSICDNASTADGNNAQHVRGLNTGSIGVAVCCMLGAVEGKSPGEYPFLLRQWHVMVAVCAELCVAYDLAVSPRSVLGHGEVERVYKVQQKGKWDPLFLPWRPSLSADRVGDLFRLRVAEHVHDIRTRDEQV